MLLLGNCYLNKRVSSQTCRCRFLHQFRAVCVKTKSCTSPLGLGQADSPCVVVASAAAVIRKWLRLLLLESSDRGSFNLPVLCIRLEFMAAKETTVGPLLLSTRGQERTLCKGQLTGYIFLQKNCLEASRERASHIARCW
jgi:hypothetical protein